MRSTVTVHRTTVHEDFDITVVVSHGTACRPRIVVSLDEAGGRVRLTRGERERAIALATDGVDETGR